MPDPTIALIIVSHHFAELGSHLLPTGFVHNLRFKRRLNCMTLPQENQYVIYQYYIL